MFYISIRGSQRCGLLRKMFGLILFLNVWILLCPCASADTLPVGFLSWDVTQPGLFAQFDIANETGPNSSADATFPIGTPLHFTNLVLSVQFNDLSVRLFSFSQLTLNPFDGLSFDSPTLAIGGANLQPVSASLTGQFASSSVTLYDGTVVNIDPFFTSNLTPAAGPRLADGDLALIVAQVVSTPAPTPPITVVTPDPPTWLLVGSAALLFCLIRPPFSRTS